MTQLPTDAQIRAAAKVLLASYQAEYDGGHLSEFLAEAESVLIAALNVVEPPLPSDFTCGYCGAEPGYRCVDKHGATTAYDHADRLHQENHWWKVQRQRQHEAEGTV